MTEEEAQAAEDLCPIEKMAPQSPGSIFSERFADLCKEMQIDACAFVVNIPTTGKCALMGHVPTIQMLQAMLNKTAMAARFRAEREARKAEEFAKRNPDLSL